jgi:hypothetical protein
MRSSSAEVFVAGAQCVESALANALPKEINICRRFGNHYTQPHYLNRNVHRNVREYSSLNPAQSQKITPRNEKELGNWYTFGKTVAFCAFLCTV